MTISMYRASVPAFQNMLKALGGVLQKANAHAAAKKIDASVLLGMRLAPDMFALTRQVQIACDFAKGCAARLAGVEVPKYDDGEASFDDLAARIAKTLAFIDTLPREQIEASATRPITLTIGGKDMHFDGLTYLLDFVLPNFYFHLTTAYDILRHAGVELGKRDFMGM